MRPPPNNSNKVVLIVVLSIVGLFVIGCGVVVYLATKVVGSESVQGMVSAITEIERLSKTAPAIVDGLTKYRATHNQAWPKKMEELKDNLAADVYRIATENFTYAQPPKDAPEDFAVLKSKKFSFMDAATMWLEVDTTLEMFTVQRTTADKDAKFNFKF